MYFVFSLVITVPQRYSSADDTQIVPNVYIPPAKIQQAPPACGSDDMDQLVEDIDRLDQELSQQWLEM